MASNYLNLRIINLFNLVLLFSLNNGNPIPKEVEVLQNPDLFGGDILGFNVNDLNVKNAKPFDYDLWPGGTIPFVIDKSLDNARHLIIRGMNHFHQYTCIRFRNRTFERDYVKIFKGDGCYSFVGRTGGQQVLSLGEGCWHQATIIHELMHAVGFFHEQSRSDRDDYLDIYKDNIANGLANQFEKLSPWQNRLLSPFDFNSVMLYGPTTFSKNGQATMLPKKVYKNVNMKEVYKKYGLSYNDIQAIEQLYKCRYNNTVSN